MSPITVTLFDDAPVYGGAERYLELLATGFDRAKVSPRVVLAREAALDPLAARLVTKGVPVTRLPRVPTLSAAGAFLRVLGHFLRNRSRILHFNLVDPRACNAAIVAARVAGHSTIVATNQLPQSPFDSLPTPARHRLALASIKRHIVVSAANATDLAATKVDPGRISVIHNATGDPGPAIASRRSDARVALGVPAEGPVVGFAGRLVAQKAPATFVEAAAEVAKVRGDARFVVIGDGSERSSLAASARILGLAGSLAFLGHRPDAIELYSGLDLLVFTSRYEGLPFAAIEAMGLGIPVVALRIPGIEEAVVDGTTGRLVEPEGGAKALAAAILDLLWNDDLRSSMGRAARAHALDRFSLRDMVQRTVAVYHAVLGRGLESADARAR